MLTGIDGGRRHNGGAIVFGPDGLLYVGTGDAADDYSAQDPTDLNGRSFVWPRTGGPLPATRTAARPCTRWVIATFRVSRRQPWPALCHRVRENEVDEINLIEAGRNYGWPEIEGTGDTGGGRYTNPLLTWPVREASPSGAAVLGSTLYVAALRGERLWAVPLDGRGGVGRPTALLDGTHGRLRTVVAAPDGGLWVSTSNRDGRGDVRDGDDRILRIVPRPDRRRASPWHPDVALEPCQ